MASSVGSLVHFSIPVRNIKESSQFYSKIFGWKLKEMTSTYYMIEGGIGALSVESENVSGTMPILYFSVQDIQACLKQVENCGGTIVLNKMNSGDGSSFFATFRDINGVVIGIWSNQ